MSAESQLSEKTSRTKSRPIDTNQPESPTLDQKRKAALESYENLRAFYQGETIKYSRWYITLQVLTLVGSALTPVLLLVTSFPKVIQALPSALGGLAAAINASFHYRQYWADNYYTLSSLMTEYDRFRVRASPEYGAGEAEAITAFQNRISGLAMSEVSSWRDFIRTDKEHKAAVAGQQDAR